MLTAGHWGEAPVGGIREEKNSEYSCSLLENEFKMEINGRIHNATLHPGGTQGRSQPRVFAESVLQQVFLTEHQLLAKKNPACITNLSCLSSRSSWCYSCCACQRHISTPSVGTARCKCSMQTFKEAFEANFSHFCVSSTPSLEAGLCSHHIPNSLFFQAADGTLRSSLDSLECGTG